MSNFMQHLDLLLSSTDVMYACNHTKHCTCCVQRLASERDRDADEVPADTEVSAGAAAL